MDLKPWYWQVTYRHTINGNPGPVQDQSGWADSEEDAKAEADTFADSLPESSTLVNVSCKKISKKVEYVTAKQWESQAKRVERRNLKERGRSLTFTGIMRRARAYIINVHDGGLLVRTGWRGAMRTEESDQPAEAAGEEK